MINANLQVAVERGEVSPRGSVHRQETLDFPLPISRDGGSRLGLELGIGVGLGLGLGLDFPLP